MFHAVPYLASAPSAASTTTWALNGRGLVRSEGQKPHLSPDQAITVDSARPWVVTKRQKVDYGKGQRRTEATVGFSGRSPAE